MPLMDILKAIKTFEEDITVEFAGATVTPSAYLVVPARRVTNATDQAVFTNYPDRAEELRLGNTREDNYSIKVRLTTYDADYDRACELALAFYDATWTAFDAERTYTRRLEGAFNGHMNLRAEEPLLANFEGRPGFEIFLDIQNFEEVD